MNRADAALLWLAVRLRLPFRRMAVLNGLPPNLLPGLDEADQAAIRAIVGCSVNVAGFRWGKVELQFIDEVGIDHSIWVDPCFVRSEA